jgi:hypothetical protein
VGVPVVVFISSQFDLHFHTFESVHEVVGFEVLTVVVMKSSVTGDIVPCSLLKVNQRFWRNVSAQSSGLNK